MDNRTDMNDMDHMDPENYLSQGEERPLERAIQEVEQLEVSGDTRAQLMQKYVSVKNLNLALEERLQGLESLQLEDDDSRQTSNREKKARAFNESMEKHKEPSRPKPPSQPHTARPAHGPAIRDPHRAALRASLPPKQRPSSLAVTSRDAAISSSDLRLHTKASTLEDLQGRPLPSYLPPSFQSRVNRRALGEKPLVNQSLSGPMSFCALPAPLPVPAGQADLSDVESRPGLRRVSSTSPMPASLRDLHTRLNLVSLQLFDQAQAFHAERLCLLEENRRLNGENFILRQSLAMHKVKLKKLKTDKERWSLAAEMSSEHVFNRLVSSMDQQEQKQQQQQQQQKPPDSQATATGSRARSTPVLVPPLAAYCRPTSRMSLSSSLLQHRVPSYVSVDAGSTGSSAAAAVATAASEKSVDPGAASSGSSTPATSVSDKRPRAISLMASSTPPSTDQIINSLESLRSCFQASLNQQQQQQQQPQRQPPSFGPPSPLPALPGSPVLLTKPLSPLDSPSRSASSSPQKEPPKNVPAATAAIESLPSSSSRTLPKSFLSKHLTSAPDAL